MPLFKKTGKNYMPRPMGHIRILMSSRVLLDLEEADTIFREQGKQAYTDYLRCNGEYAADKDPDLGCRRLGKGPLFDVAVALFKLNALSKDPIVEIGLSCKDEIASARAIFRNLAVTDLGPALEWDTATAGRPVSAEIHKAFKTDLFLTRSASDAQIAIDLGIAAAVINFPPVGTYDYNPEGPVRIIVDGDAVAFGDSAELGFRNDVDTIPNYNDAVTTYKEREHQDVDKAIEPGPFTAVLAKIAELNDRFEPGNQPFEIGLLTARGGRASGRALTALETYGIKFNYPSGFMGGADKGEWLEAHRPHLFLDDQKTHLDRGMHFCPTGLVPYKKDGLMQDYLLKKSKPATDFTEAAKCEGKGCDKADCGEVHKKLKVADKSGGPAPK